MKYRIIEERFEQGKHPVFTPEHRVWWMWYPWYYETIDSCREISFCTYKEAEDFIKEANCGKHDYLKRIHKVTL